MATRKWGSEKLVNTGTAGNQYRSDVAALTGGGYVVVWQDDSTTQSAIRAQRYDTVGNRAGAEFIIEAAPANDSTLPSVTALADGGFYVNWTFNTGPDNYILGKVYDANGTFVRDQVAAFANGLDSEAANARLGAGSMVAWVDPDATFGDVAVRVFDAAGAGGGVFTANTTTADTQRSPSLAAAPDGDTFVVTWDGGASASIRGRVFTAAGAESAPEFIIADDGGIGTITKNSAVTWLTDNQFAVAWQKATIGLAGGWDIRVSIYDGQQSLVRPVVLNIPVNASTDGDQENPEIVALPGGGLVVAWQSFSGIGPSTNRSIKLQAFDGSGGKIGGEVLVNTSVFTIQSNPSLSALADGRVVVTWTASTAISSDVRMQIVDPRQGIVEGTEGAETLYGHDAVGDEINGHGGADIAFGLAGNDQLYGGDGNDTLNGGKDNDTLFGGDGNDTLVGDLGDDDQFGELGNDNLRGSVGFDLLDGGEGIDTANFGSGTVAITVALDGSLVSTGDAAGDTFVDIEDVWGTNAATGDTLVGNGAHNALLGLNGNDNLRGQNGNDQLIGGLGSDTLRGDSGDDRYNYNALTEGGDIMLDFGNSSNNNDAFQFRATAFGGGAPGFVLATRFITRAADNLAQDANDNFIFQQNTRQFWYDATGNATAGDAILIATLQVGGTMTAVDVLMF